MGVDDKQAEATSSALEQGFVVSPADKRFLLLFTFLKKNRKKKVIAYALISMGPRPDIEPFKTNSYMRVGRNRGNGSHLGELVPSCS